MYNQLAEGEVLGKGPRCILRLPREDRHVSSPTAALGVILADGRPLPQRRAATHRLLQVPIERCPARDRPVLPGLVPQSAEAAQADARETARATVQLAAGEDEVGGGRRHVDHAHDLEQELLRQLPHAGVLRGIGEQLTVDLNVLVGRCGALARVGANIPLHAEQRVIKQRLRVHIPLPC